MHVCSHKETQLVPSLCEVSPGETVEEFSSHGCRWSMGNICSRPDPLQITAALTAKMDFFFLSSRNARKGFEDRIRIFEEQSKQQKNTNNNINKTNKQAAKKSSEVFWEKTC